MWRQWEKSGYISAREGELRGLRGQRELREKDGGNARLVPTTLLNAAILLSESLRERRSAFEEGKMHRNVAGEFAEIQAFQRK